MSFVAGLFVGFVAFPVLAYWMVRRDETVGGQVGGPARHSGGAEAHHPRSFEVDW